MPIAIHRTQGHHTSTPERWNKRIIYFFFRPGESPPPARVDDTALWGTMLRTLLTCLLGLNAVLPAASIGPRVVSQEEILEMVDEWLYAFDEDDDGFLAGSELEGLLKQLRQGSSVTGDAAAALTPQLLMTQVRSVA